MRRLRDERWLTTPQAVKHMRRFIPAASPRWFQAGGHRAKQFPEPERIGQRLYWNERELNQWLVRRGLTEWSEL